MPWASLCQYAPNTPPNFNVAFKSLIPHCVFFWFWKQPHMTYYHFPRFCLNRHFVLPSGMFALLPTAVCIQRAGLVSRIFEDCFWVPSRTSENRNRTERMFHLFQLVCLCNIVLHHPRWFVLNSFYATSRQFYWYRTVTVLPMVLTQFKHAIVFVLVH